MPTDKLYAYVPDAGNNLTATLAGTPVADFTSSPYSPTGNVYNDPALLYNAQAPAAPTVQTNRGPLYDIREEFGLTAPDITSAFNAQGASEKYFQSTNGSNAPNGGYYVLLPDGDLYAWDGNSIATTVLQAPVANLSSYGVYANTALLYDALPAFINDPVFAAKDQYGLTTPASRFQSPRLKASIISRAAMAATRRGSGYYVLMPGGDLYAYVPDASDNLLTNTLAGTPVAVLGASVYANPALLNTSTGLAPAVTATVDSSGNVTLTPNVAFAGTEKITVTVSDGVAVTSQSFFIPSRISCPCCPRSDP